METTTKTIDVKLTITKYIASDGTIFETTTQEAINKAINSINILSNKNSKLCGEHELKLEKVKKRAELMLIPEYAKYVEFYEKFYIEYKDNPSMNGGNFIFSEPGEYSGNIDNDWSDKQKQQLLSDIKETLSCNLWSRDWGYGSNRLGTKHVKEDKETAKVFLEWLENSGIDLETETNTNDWTIKQGLLMYCIRSGYYEGVLKYSESIDTERKNILIEYVIKDLLKINERHVKADVYWPKKYTIVLILWSEYVSNQPKQILKNFYKSIANDWLKILNDDLTVNTTHYTLKHGK